MQLTTFINQLPEPAALMINGARGSGKDVTAHQICRTLHDKTEKPVYININPKKYKLPKYFKKHKGNFVNNSILYLNDVALEYYATEWGSDKTKTLVRIMNLCRHKDIDMVWTTLLAVDVPLNTIRRMDASIYKEPVYRAERWERYALREEVSEARQVFEALPPEERLTTAVAFTQYGKFIITDITVPFYWTDELSKAHSGYTTVAPPQVIKIKQEER